MTNMDKVPEGKRLQIIDVAHSLGRVPHTVRVWEREGRLPEHLRPERDERGWRYWTEEQVEGIRQWLIDENIRPGSFFINKKKEKT